MRDKGANSDLVIANIAAKQHGVMTGGQLRALGIDRRGISRRAKAGRLHRVHRGVYAVGHACLSFDGRCLAAALALGDAAVVSHRSAAALWGMLSPPTGAIDITVGSDAGRKTRAGITIHRSLTLVAGSTTHRHGIPVTRPERTLRDLRRLVPPALHQKAVRRALDLRLVASEAFGPDPDLTRSELERIFLRLCRRRRLPTPEVNARLGRFEVDFLWREQSVIVETDGFRHHGDRAAFEADRARDAELLALGYRVIRFTYRQLRETPDGVVGSLRAVLGQS